MLKRNNSKILVLSIAFIMNVIVLILLYSFYHTYPISDEDTQIGDYNNMREDTQNYVYLEINSQDNKISLINTTQSINTDFYTGNLLYNETLRFPSSRGEYSFSRGSSRSSVSNFNVQENNNDEINNGGSNNDNLDSNDNDNSNEEDNSNENNEELNNGGNDDSNNDNSNEDNNSNSGEEVNNEDLNVSDNLDSDDNDNSNDDNSNEDNNNNPPSDSNFPGGFIEDSFSEEVRSSLSVSNINSFLPSQKGEFTFPEPYNTIGVRVTDNSDCNNGADCVFPIGYSYWKNINNHVDNDVMYIFLSLDENGGPTLFSYNKVTGEVKNEGALFESDTGWSFNTGEGWYFSATMPNKLYITDNSESDFYRYDILNKEFEKVLDLKDAPSLFSTEMVITHMHSSDDDNVHIGIVLEDENGGKRGCFVYIEDEDEYKYFQEINDLDECNIDKSGKWLLIIENLDSANGVDNRIINLQTNEQIIILDEEGAAGHYDMGNEYIVHFDNWHNLENAITLLELPPVSTTRPIGEVMYHGINPDIDHISHQNRKGTDYDSQFACGSNLYSDSSTEAEIICFRLDGSLKKLIVAPVMSSLSGQGGSDAYSKHPKGNLDVTGEYFIWTANLKGDRLDVFIVKVPWEKMYD